MTKSSRSWTAAITGVALVALALSGCSGAGGSASSGKIDAAAKSAAQKVVATALKEPVTRKLTLLTKKPATGKNVVMLSCPLAACKKVEAPIIDASKLLGWNARVLVYDFTPESYISTFESALQLKPDFIYYIANLPDSIITEQLKAAKAAGIVVLSSASGPSTKLGADELVRGSITAGADRTRVSKLQAATVINDADSLDGITYLYDPAGETYKLGFDVFSDEIKKAGGTVDGLEINQSDIGTTLPGKVASYLQVHPNTKYFVVPHDAFLPGIIEAIQGAGLPLPKIVGFDPQPESQAPIKAGTEWESIKYDGIRANWDIVDMMARISVGDPVTETQPAGLLMIANKKNLSKIPDVFPGVPSDFAKAWLVN
ncbi:MAG: hypothetical protein JWO10_1719 [Microbacteriaceae bacterium]|nr:hypothetical protein [Microbacteriaceae bacterium]